ncbi:MAG TPA: inorganic phosphate transporter, partial [Rhabdochlamydiaceae bacterium]|nr:inorganic phosphate transporter [Rhabdochlamydiaceae bacterium]
LILVIGFYMAWNIGANDVSNAMGTSVGSGALTLRRAVILAGNLEFCGAYFVGANVSETMERGLVNPEIFATQPLILVLGMCGALLGTSFWLQLASYLRWPVSTTHAIVGAIIGFGIIAGGFHAILWEEVSFIAVSWIVSPVISAIISYSIFSLLQKKILYAMDPIEATRRAIPFFFFIVFLTFTLSLMTNGLQNLNLQISFAGALGIAFLVGGIAAVISYFVVQRIAVPVGYIQPEGRHSPQTVLSLDKAIKHLQRVRVSSADETHEKISLILQDVKSLSRKIREETNFGERASEYHFVEKVFVYLQIISACYVAFAHGANDVANAIGPVAAVLGILKNGYITEATIVPPWLLALGGIGIVIGLATWGWRVIETIGKKITELTPTRGFCAEFGAATTILVASKLGLPISTTHCLVGAVLGVGLARGLSALNLGMLREIVLSWVVTIPASAGMSILCFYILKSIFL